MEKKDTKEKRLLVKFGNVKQVLHLCNLCTHHSAIQLYSTYSMWHHSEGRGVGL